ncbi:hypothetical protein ASG73_15780 [Janibacter sp. Soil728]|uniref:helix-turn-helix domain-containing protein n=1 Tax=Janibacter sp. Soil728 TaxID=1736393 RepID=UPI0007007AEB|nr:helix-turn-helix transcriptional regulator [Janibacter sp. Soil728]KRE36109.1 hypothetical protein ASG73_15780 [Janibacter sp. Soil728]
MSKNPLDALPGNLGNNLGDYLREQRLTKKLSLRQLSAIAGISNPYLSQIERGIKRPSAEILQQIGKGLSISAETLYVQAGLLDPKDAAAEAEATTRAAIAADPALTSRQRQTMLEIYESFVGGSAGKAPKRVAQKAAATKTTAKKKSAASTKGSSVSSGSKTTPAPRAGRKTPTSSSTSTSRRTS